MIILHLLEAAMYDRNIIDRIGREVGDSAFFDDEIRPALWYPGADITLVTSDGNEVLVSIPDNDETYDAYSSNRKFPCDELCEVDVYAVDDDGGREPLAHYERDGGFYAFEAFQDAQVPQTMIVPKTNYVEEYVNENVGDTIDSTVASVREILAGHDSGFDPETYVKVKDAVEEMNDALKDIDGYSDRAAKGYLDIGRMVLEADQYMDNWYIDEYSDMYKDVHGFRPHGPLVAPYLSDEEQERRRSMLSDYLLAGDKLQQEQMAAMAELDTVATPKSGQMQMNELFNF
jgi:hypothetical protein